MSLKQSSQEYAANIVALQKSILPAVLADTAANGQMMSGYLLKNFQDKNGLVDASVANLRKAVAALHAGGFIDWAVAPGKLNRARETADTTRSQDVVKEAVEKFDVKVEQEALASCRSIILSYRGRVHSVTYRRRDILQAKLDDLLAQKTKPTAIKKVLETTVNGFPD